MSINFKDLITALTITPDERMIVAGDSQGYLRVFRISGSQFKKMKSRNQAGILKLEKAKAPSFKNTFDTPTTNKKPLFVEQIHSSMNCLLELLIK